MQGLALTLLRAFEQPAEAPQLFLDHVILGACSHLTSRYGGASRAALARGGLSPRQVARAQAYIAAHHTENITLGDLAHQANLSRSHFTRGFRKALGMAPYPRLLRYRIERAKELMLHSDLSLERIALACGFSDQSHVTRIFKQTVAISPGAWRRDRKGSWG
ncbi:MAG: helix-turn-helix transcriptional regulator [Alphaproteobacteria bacterium]|nr:helix-turn-helix transcriptional regulator [Alphaproteobacteria bacterium]